jgi:hypothetical protein
MSLAPHAKMFFQTICYRLVKLLFLFHGSPIVEGDLNEYAIAGSLDTEIGGIENEAFGRMFCDYLETIVVGDFQGLGHRFVDYLADGFSICGWFALGEINSDERHGGFFPGYGLMFAAAFVTMDAAEQESFEDLSLDWT